MSDAVMVPRAWLLKVVDTLKPFAEVAEKLRHCHVVEICEPHPDNPSPNIAVMPREWLERAGDDLETAVIALHRDGALSEGQAAKMTGLDRVEVRKLSDALAASTPVGGWEGPEREEALKLLRTINREYDIGRHEADVLSIIDRLAAPPPPSVSNGSRPQEAVPTEGHDAAVVGWKCNCCKTRFASDWTARVPNGFDEHGTGPSCPRCKAGGAYTYPYSLHEGDPCVRCGVGHDDVAPGECPGPQPADGCSSNEGAGGWIEWGGGENPVGDKMVAVKFRDGSACTDNGSAWAGRVSDWIPSAWTNTGGAADIIAYRILPQTEKGS